jgi:hypothetical protein
MRRAFALAALIAVSSAGAAFAEHWTKFADGENGTEWSYDSDYTYKDKATGRIVVMQAISKPSANLMPGGPDASYRPSKPFEIPASWRSDTPKNAGGPEDQALFAAVCPVAGKVPVK